jgi:2-oxoglutarate dehydrogenase E2 component (dihydrolipoamide succinyltransferase)
VRWLKSVGETVERDEALSEITTEIVDAEIPCPTAGILRAIYATAGQTVAINSVVGAIGKGRS